MKISIIITPNFHLSYHVCSSSKQLVVLDLNLASHTVPYLTSSEIPVICSALTFKGKFSKVSNLTLRYLLPFPLFILIQYIGRILKTAFFSISQSLTNKR